MTEVYENETRIRSKPTSRQPSPIPRRQLGMLPLNQRSYSRMSSKGMLGDDSTLMSPLPFYPRRRSVKFAGDESREERPYYNPTFSASAPVSPVRTRDASPPPVSILKSNSSYPEAEPNAAAPHSQPAAAKSSRNASPVPTRGRSGSRQRLAARRREAQLHHSFYDDSFVEEFVLNTKTEQEKEDAQRKLEREMQREQEKARLAEERSKESNGKIAALLHAKEVLRAAAKRHRSSETPSPARNTVKAAKKSDAEVLKTLEEDSDPDVQEALAEIAATTHKANRHGGGGGGGGGGAGGANRRRRSQPIASENALLLDVDEESDVDQSENSQDRKRAKLERIVSNILTKQAKSKSKHSVVVINWSDSESQGEDSGASVRPTHRTRSRSANLATARQASQRKGGSSKRTVPSRKRSAVPDLGDSLLFEDEAEQPILLPRRTHKKPTTTRSISQLDEEADDAVLDEADIEKVIRKPPRAPRRAPAKQPVRKNQTRSHNTNNNNNSNSTMNSTFTSTHSEQYIPEAESTAAPVRRRAPRGNTGKVAADDPMAVFFDAAFPSPSKFDEMMVRAGGLPEGRRGGRGQPNLVLPSSIGRRR